MRISFSGLSLNYTFYLKFMRLRPCISCSFNSKIMIIYSEAKTTMYGYRCMGYSCHTPEGNDMINMYYYLAYWKQQLNMEKKICMNKGKQVKYYEYLFINHIKAKEEEIVLNVTSNVNICLTFLVCAFL